MLISTKGRYALRVMIDLAEHQNAGYIPLKEVASRQGISEKYLESIIKLLVKANLLNGSAGQGGRLSPDPHPGQLYRGQRPAADGGLPGPPCPVWSREHRCAASRLSAAPCPCGGGWTRSSTTIWTTSPSPI